MRQQINLYQPILREESKLFGAKTAVRTFAVVLAALLAFSAYGTFKVKRLQQAAETLRDQQSQQEQSFSTLSTMSASRGMPLDVTAQLRRAQAQVAAANRALDLMRTGAVGRTTGFAARLEALARRHLDGVWIDRMALSGTTEAMSLGGATVDPDLVPRYLRNLSQESVLAGTRFDQLAIERQREKASAQVRFRASSETLPARAASTEEEGPT